MIKNNNNNNSQLFSALPTDDCDVSGQQYFKNSTRQSCLSEAPHIVHCFSPVAFKDVSLTCKYVAMFRFLIECAKQTDYVCAEKVFAFVTPCTAVIQLLLLRQNVLRQ